MNATSSFWEQLEGVILDGKYNLQQCLAAEGDQAVFLTEPPGGQPRQAAVKLIRTDPHTEADILSRWRMAMELSHPSLVRIFAVERVELDGASFLYAVMDYAEDSLASVLCERALSEAETLDVLGSLLPALEYLHGRGFVHGHIKPGNILAVKDTIKISSDGLGRGTDLSPAEDMRSLGMIVCEMLTQRLPGTGDGPEEVAATLPDRFRDLVQNCLQTAPQQRWSAARAAESLRLGEGGTSAAAAVPKRGRWKWLAIAALSVGVLIAVFARRAERPAPPEIRPASTANAPQGNPKPIPLADRKVGQESKASEEPAPRQGQAAAERDGHAIWRVIVYTYTRRGDANNRIRQINKRWPEFHAEVFSLDPGQPPYLVSIGGRMPREDALRLLQKVRAARLPADSYTQNFSH